ncbi:hypothetical protein [Spirillospora sp. CA-294931]|uniref:hypothetical protein n=1 Tax=Spirillospora sp. CA-294931 TaxID=3240042 RepID=UPI003D8A6F93
MLGVQLGGLLDDASPGADEALDLVAGFDDALVHGFARLGEERAAALGSLAGALASSPLGPAVEEAVGKVAAGSISERHLTVLAGARSALFGAVHDARLAGLDAALGRERAGWEPGDTVPDPVSANLLGGCRSWLHELAITGWRGVDHDLVSAADQTIEALLAEPGLRRLAVLLDGLAAELRASCPIATAATVPALRWADLWSRAMLLAHKRPWPATAKPVRGDVPPHPLAAGSAESEPVPRDGVPAAGSAGSEAVQGDDPPGSAGSEAAQGDDLRAAGSAGSEALRGDVSLGSVGGEAAQGDDLRAAGSEALRGDNPPAAAGGEMVSGRLLILGADVHEHATAVQVQVHAVFEPSDGSARRLVRVSVAAAKVDTIVGPAVWNLLEGHPVLLTALAERRSLTVEALALLPGGDLLWQDDRAEAGEAADPFATARLQLTGALAPAVPPLDRHPVRIAEPVLVEGYTVDGGSLNLDGNVLPLDLDRLPACGPITRELVAASSSCIGLLRWDGGRWALQPLAVQATVKRKPVEAHNGDWALGPTDPKVVKAEARSGDAVAVLRERAGRLLRK